MRVSRGGAGTTFPAEPVETGRQAGRQAGSKGLCGAIVFGARRQGPGCIHGCSHLIYPLKDRPENNYQLIKATETQLYHERAARVSPGGVCRVMQSALPDVMSCKHISAHTTSLDLPSDAPTCFVHYTLTYLFSCGLWICRLRQSSEWATLPSVDQLSTDSEHLC